MSKELIVSSSTNQTAVALTENDQLAELLISRGSLHGLAGSIYKGRVTRVLPGMQAAFVNIGLDRDAFLYVTDFFGDPEDFEDLPQNVLAPPAATVDAVEEAAESTPAAEPQTGAAEPPPERRERRGRRSRRRRGRGRFPDSKYAAVGSPDAAPETAVQKAEPEPPPPVDRKAEEVERPEELPMLPGESLAKYSADDDEFEAEAGAADSEGPGVQESSARRERDETRGPDLSREQSTDEDDEETTSEVRRPAVRGWETTEDDDGHPRPGMPAKDPNPPDREKTERQRDRFTASPSAFVDTPSAGPGEALSERASTAEEAEASAGDDSDEIWDDSFDDDVSPEETDSAEESEEVSVGEKSDAHAETEESQRGEARVRGRSGSAGLVRRGGRRGRRRYSSRGSEGRDDAETASPAPQAASITSLLSTGQEILVQISKEPLGKKGARITSHIAMPGRYLVYMPTVEHVGVSRKIANDQERLRLRKIVQTHRVGMPGGFIVRTAGDGATEEEVRGDMLFLYNLWLDIRQKAERRPAPSLIHQDLDVVERVLRDQLGEDFKTVWVDSEEEYERVLRFVERFQPDLLTRVKLFTRPKPIFDEFNITQEIDKALRPKVWLKSGGYIVINQTEALVAVDVNTGKFVGKSDRLEDTIVKTNLEAVQEIVRQMRLRDLGGIIVLDFIDMEDRKNRQKVMTALEQELRKDRAPSKALAFNEFGLVSITRKRVKQSLERTLCTSCPYCTGSGYVKSVETIVLEILDEARKMAPKMRSKKEVTIRVNPEVGRLLKSRDNYYLQEIEEAFRSNAVVRSDNSLHREHFDIN